MEISKITYNSDRWLLFSFITIILVICLLPLWVSLLLLAIAVFFVTSPHRIFLSAFLILLSAFFNAGVDITGDLVTYSSIFENIDKTTFTQEFAAEPLLLFFYNSCKQLGLDFKSALFIQSFLMNSVLMYALCVYFGTKALKIFPAIILYPQFIQQGLFLSRQSLSTLLFIALVVQGTSHKKAYFKSLTFGILALLSHAAAILNIGLYLVSRKIKGLMRWYWVLPIVLAALLLPLNESFITQHLAALTNISGSLDRKIGFYMNDGSEEATLGVFSLLMLPLHATFLLISTVLIKSKNTNNKIDSFSIIFIILYTAMLFLRNYSLLPTRLGMPIIIFSSLFFFNVTTLYSTLIKRVKLYETAFFIFICITFVRFLYTNDYGDYAITILGKESLLMSPINILFNK
ncbi:EpsG family protein [Siccibacter turicensis]|uniref:EpsG family protein n=1 Tax=Siccibacter turicensis TaxID=357233 RepID=UPI0010212C1A|nr:EpsG family protein [Siccibacter turicensis]